MLTLLSKPLFWLLDMLHSIFNNWGLAIILVTFLLKLAFYPLSETSRHARWRDEARSRRA